MVRLFVNLDHVATLRNARGTPYPDILDAALLAEATGYVQGITLHLREDRRHVNDQDMRRVHNAIRMPFNFEMSVAEEIVQLCEELAPPLATLVPERREEVTTEGGLDVISHRSRVHEVSNRLVARGVTVSLFVDPQRDIIAACADSPATHIELHTGRYADAATAEDRARELKDLQAAAAQAQELGLVVNAGHGLTAKNVPAIATIPGIHDLNIGHSIVSRSVFLGLPGALKEMAQAIGCLESPST